MLSSLLSPPLPLPAVLGDSLSISCWTDDCWFSSLIPFAMFAKSISDFVNSFGSIPTIHASVYKRDTAWKVSVFRVIPFSCIRSKYREIHRISPYLVRMRENAWRTTPETGTFTQWNALATGCLYCLNKLTAWQVCVACIPSVSLISKSK